jgi:hypothetical protein
MEPGRELPAQVMAAALTANEMFFDLCSHQYSWWYQIGREKGWGLGWPAFQSDLSVIGNGYRGGIVGSGSDNASH